MPGSDYSSRGSIIAYPVAGRSGSLLSDERTTTDGPQQHRNPQAELPPPRSIVEESRSQYTKHRMPFLPTVTGVQSMKKIAVTIPSYNNRRWYRRNLSSVLAQNYCNFRVIY